MTRIVLNVVFLGLMGLGLPGCLALDPPAVVIKSIEVTGVNKDAMSVALHGTVANEHGGETRLLEFDYRLSISGRSVYQGRHAAEMTLIPGANREIMLPASFPFTELGWDSQSLPDTSNWSMSGSLLYLGEGVLAETLLDMGYRPTVGFSASGELVLEPPN